MPEELDWDDPNIYRCQEKVETKPAHFWSKLGLQASGLGLEEMPPKFDIDQALNEQPYDDPENEETDPFEAEEVAYLGTVVGKDGAKGDIWFAWCEDLWPYATVIVDPAGWQVIPEASLLGIEWEGEEMESDYQRYLAWLEKHGVDEDEVGTPGFILFIAERLRKLDLAARVRSGPKLDLAPIVAYLVMQLPQIGELKVVAPPPPPLDKDSRVEVEDVEMGW